MNQNQGTSRSGYKAGSGALWPPLLGCNRRCVSSNILADRSLDETFLRRGEFVLEEEFVDFGAVEFVN